MTRALRAGAIRRSVALLLFTVFLGAGTTLPGADALVHHWGGGGVEEQRPHLDPAGGCAGHTDSCTLGRTATGAGATLGHAATVRLEASGSAPHASAPDLRLPAAGRGALPQPRAPPVPVA
ncbi:MAG TPA: hypothetical protein VMN37_09890 [Gemmatimonadales bacterium]|nr:hypothetical protein [Gemmatimonadales bacterium]